MSKIKTIVYITAILIGIQMAFGATLLYEDFEGTTFPPTGWTNGQTGTAQNWMRRTSGQVFRTGASAGVCIFYSGSGGNTQGTSYLKTPALNFSSTSVESLSFYFRCPGTGSTYGLCSALDTIKVEVSTNGSDWYSVLVIDSSYIHNLPRQTAVRDTGYKLTCDLSSYNSQSNIYIRWMYYDNYAEPSGGTNRYFNIDSVYVYDQEEFQPNQPPTISNVTRIPTNPEPSQSVIVRAKIYDDYCPLTSIIDSLYYAVNDSSTWTKVYHDSMHTADSTFYYTIPGQTNGSKVYYYVWAQDDSNASVRTPTYSYNVIAPPTARILMRPRYVQGGATAGTPGTGTPFAFYVGVKPGANNDSFYYKGRIGGRGLTWNISGNNWAADNAAWTSLSKILCGSVNDTTKVWVFMKAQPTATVDTALSFRVRHIDAGLNYDSDTLPIKILDMTTAGDGGWLYGHIYEYDSGPARENVVVLAYQGEEIVGAYATENNNIDEGYNASDAGYIRMAVKSGTIDSLQVRNRTTNEILSFYTEISGPWTVFAGDSTSLDIQQAPIITNVTRNPAIPLLGELVTVTAKIYDMQTPLAGIIDTLFYAFNTTTTWNYVLKNSYNPSDSTFNYTIPATALEGDTVFYKISATDGDNNTTISATYRYTIPFERTIDQIQGATSASPETLKYVHTKGIVTGTFGSRFFFAQRPGGARNELYVYRRYQDSLPKLNIGDSVSVIGIVKEYNTLTEIDAGYNLNGDVRIHATGKPLPCTTLLAIAGVAEDYEGCLIRIDSLHFKATGTFAGGTNYWACNNNETESLRVRIDAACLDIIGQPIPTETIAIIGNLSVYKDTFQLMPRFLSDLHSLQQILDVGVVSVDAPSGTLYQGFSYPVKATVKNYGNVPAPQFDVIFTITATKGGEYCDTVTVLGLAVGQQSSITFDNYLASDLGLFSTMAKTVLSGDVNVANDSNFGSGIEVVAAPPAFWTQKEPIETTVPKAIKDGGALVGVGTDLYAFVGTKTNKFKKYTIGSGWSYTDNESLPFGYKYPIDSPPRINKKFPGKGAALCYDGVNTIYATRGNGTREFWSFNLTTRVWTLEESIPVPKGVKYGTALAFMNGKVYLLAGAQKKTDVNNFYVFDTTTRHWSASAPLELGSYNKPWKDGSCLAVCDGQIYALKGGDKDNLFYAFDGNSWTPKETLPKPDTVFGSAKTKVLVKAGGCMASDGNVIYAVKGGGTDCFWKYTPGTPGVWEMKEPIPVIDKKHAPKTSAAMAYADGKIWLLVGNKQPDFWCYTPGVKSAVVAQSSSLSVIASESEAISNSRLSFMFSVNPNPFSKLTTIQYTVPISGNVTIKLYNASGRLVKTLVNEYLNAGSYATTLTNIASGVYFLKYESAHHNAEVKLTVR